MSLVKMVSVILLATSALLAQAVDQSGAVEAAFGQKLASLPRHYACALDIRQKIGGQELRYSGTIERSGEKYHYLQTAPFSSSDPVAKPVKAMMEFSANGTESYSRQFEPGKWGTSVVNHKSRNFPHDPLYLLEPEGANLVPKRKTEKEVEDEFLKDSKKPGLIRSGLAVAAGREIINGVSTIRVDQLTVFHRIEGGKVTSRPLGRIVFNNPDGSQTIVGKDDWGKPGFPAEPPELAFPTTWYVDPEIGYLPRRIIVREGGNTLVSDIEYQMISPGVWFPEHGQMRWFRGGESQTPHRELELTVTGVQLVNLPAELFGNLAQEGEELYDFDNPLRWEMRDGVLVEKPIVFGQPASQPAK